MQCKTELEGIGYVGALHGHHLFLCITASLPRRRFVVLVSSPPPDSLQIVVLLFSRAFGGPFLNFGSPPSPPFRTSSLALAVFSSLDFYLPGPLTEMRAVIIVA